MTVALRRAPPCEEGMHFEGVVCGRGTLSGTVGGSREGDFRGHCRGAGEDANVTPLNWCQSLL